jgi:broad specificity phosphatase PhoE
VDALVLARHAFAYSNQSVLASCTAPGDGLTGEGREQARRLGEELAGTAVDLGVATELRRTQETLELALGDREVERIVVAELNEIDFGSFDGGSLDEYRAWAFAAPPLEPAPGGGESRAAAAARYARGVRVLLARPEPVVLLVGHALALRYVLDAATGRTDGPGRARDAAPSHRGAGGGRGRAARGVEPRADVPRSLVRGDGRRRDRPTNDSMTFRLRATTGLACVSTVVLLLVGCGGGDESASGVVVGEPIALEELSRSAAASAQATSGRFAFDMTLRIPGADEPMSFSGEGAFDEASERASFSVDMSMFAQLLGGFFGAFGQASTDGAPDFDDPDLWQIRIVQDGKVSYVNFPAISDKLPDGKSWVRSDGEKVQVDGFELEELEDVASSDPREFLKMLEAAGGEIETVGVEELRGVEVTHYRAPIDPQEAAKTVAPGDLGPLAEPLRSGVGEVPLDIWLGADGLVRKLEVAISAEEQGQAGGVSLTFELWDLGEEVEIDLPPASEVADASTLKE